MTMRQQALSTGLYPELLKMPSGMTWDKVKPHVPAHALSYTEKTR